MEQDECALSMWFLCFTAIFADRHSLFNNFRNWKAPPHHHSLTEIFCFMFTSTHHPSGLPGATDCRTGECLADPWLECRFIVLWGQTFQSSNRHCEQFQSTSHFVWSFVASLRTASGKWLGVSCKLQAKDSDFSGRCRKWSGGALARLNGVNAGNGMDGIGIC